MKIYFNFLLSLLIVTNVGVLRAGASNSSIPGIHAIGNGELCVYGRQSDILQVFGPPYSAPSILRMSVMGADSISSMRNTNTATWNHKAFNGSIPVANMTDFVSSTCNAYVRRFVAKKEIEYDVDVNLEWPHNLDDSNVTVVESSEKLNIDGMTGSYDVTVKYGVPFFFGYQSPTAFYYRLITTGSVELIPQNDNSKKFRLLAKRGEGSLIFVGATSVEDLRHNVQIVESNSTKTLQRESEKVWRAYCQNDFAKMKLPKAAKREFLQAVDDVQVLIKSQQSKSGSVLAGIMYHMGYVRDQYGVSRAFLALGHTDQARLMLEFYNNIFEDNGFVKNAQAIGHKGIFHCHENDDTEITGYLVVQAFDYYNKTRDKAFIKRIMPMLEWATNMQVKQIIDGMLPFNGDETYIAGGVVPRKVMYNGSAEATLLFIEGSMNLLDFVKEESLWSDDRFRKLDLIVTDCRNKYRNNFYCDGKLFINNPLRELNVSYPDSRPGVCNHPAHGGYFTETYHFKGGMYFCTDCMKRDNSMIQIPESELFSIPSAYLFPIYINSRIFTAQEKLTLLEHIKNQYQTTGRISSGDRILGYDLGLFLYALTKSSDKLSDKVYREMMSLRDGAGAWVEYYSNGLPSGCGCRPWESGINIEAAIEYQNDMWSRMK